MPTPNFAKLVDNCNVMSEGITTRLASLSGVGITAADATAMEDFARELNQLNAEQEELKAQLKAKTTALNVKMKNAKTKYSDLTKRIKIVVPQEEWVAFGIAAKK